MASYRSASFILLVGSMGAHSVVRMRMMQAEDVYGGKSRPIPGKKGTLKQAAGDGNDAVVVEIKGNDLRSGFAYVSAEIEVENAAADVAMLPFLGDASSKPIPRVCWTEVVDG